MKKSAGHTKQNHKIIINIVLAPDHNPNLVVMFHTLIKRNPSDYHYPSLKFKF